MKTFRIKLKASAVATQAGKQVTIGDIIGVCYLTLSVVDSTDLNMDGNINLRCWVQDNKFDCDVTPLQVEMKFRDTITKLKQAIMPLCSEGHMNLWIGG